jgi:hypothetical protein
MAYQFFGQFDSVTDLETRMANTFEDEAARSSMALARRIIHGEMKLVKQESGRITAFWEQGNGDQFSDRE